MTKTPLYDEALIEEAAKKSGLVWVRGPRGPARPLWHAWHEGAVCLVGDGPREQPLADVGLVEGAFATVTVRSRDSGGRLVRWPARVTEPRPGGDLWTDTVAELRAKRLNAPDADPEALAARWAEECRVLRLVPLGAAVQKPGAMPTESLAAPPLPTPATTRRRASTGRARRLRRRRAR